MHTCTYLLHTVLHSPAAYEQRFSSTPIPSFLTPILLRLLLPSFLLNGLTRLFLRGRDSYIGIEPSSPPVNYYSSVLTPNIGSLAHGMRGTVFPSRSHPGLRRRSAWCAPTGAFQVSVQDDRAWIQIEKVVIALTSETTQKEVEHDHDAIRSLTEKSFNSVPFCQRTHSNYLH